MHGEVNPPYRGFEKTVFGLIGGAVIVAGFVWLAIGAHTRPKLPEPPPAYMAGYHGCAAGVHGYAALVESCVNPAGGWRDLR